MRRPSIRLSTSDGSASVDVSPSAPNSFSAILRRMRRMILPLRVLGRAGVKWRWSGLAIGPIAKPDVLQFAPALPKTRSGKIMRRILRKIAEGDVENLGDTSTLADPGVVEDLVAGRPQ